VTSVISNRPDAAGLQISARDGVATHVVDHALFAGRSEFDAALMAAIDAGEPDLVVLAGFMRILGPRFIHHYAGRMINIHPSLLPAYPGLHTHRRVLADGAWIHGCTVHFVTDQLDSGPIVCQGAVAVHEDDDEQALAARVLSVEHRLLPFAVRAFCEDRLAIEDGRVRVRGASAPSTTLTVPST
jgi:phosphoribosylglycinamide formyltransferase-1